MSKALLKIPPPPPPHAGPFNKPYFSTMPTVISSFEATWIYLINPNIFTDESFLAADNFNIQNHNEVLVVTENDADISICDSTNTNPSVYAEETPFTPSNTREVTPAPLESNLTLSLKGKRPFH